MAAKKKFLRRDASRFSKFGYGRGKKASWRNPTGRDNKMREKRKGYPITVSIGHRGDKANRGKFEGKEVLNIYNLRDLSKIKNNQIAHLGKIGMKKKIEILKVAQKNKIKFRNINVEKFLKEFEKYENAKKKKIKSTNIKNEEKKEIKEKKQKNVDKKNSEEHTQ